MKLKNLLQEKRKDIIEIASKHGAFNLRIFGSVARGEETSDSDIDFLIDYNLDKISPWFPGGLLADLEDLLGCKIDIVSEKGLHDFIQQRILKEAIPL
jgi:hypothetical protein